MSGPKYYVTTWDAEKQEFTPQKGVKAGPYTLFGLRKPLRKLRNMGYAPGDESIRVDTMTPKEQAAEEAAHRRKYPSGKKTEAAKTLFE